MITVCKTCSSADIRQQTHVMVGPNDPYPFADIKDGYEWDDFFWCIPCDQECLAKEVKDDEDN